MVGNDIIDINATKRSSNKNSGWERPGFIEKIFTSNEQTIISAAKDPFTSVWKMWSIKESAYKVFIQAGGEPFFNPKRIECSFNDAVHGEVKIGEITLKTITFFNDNHIFSTATSGDSEIKSSIFELPKDEIQQQSDFIRKKLINDFAKINKLDAVNLVIRKTEAGVPLFYHKNIPLAISISMTHHGKYGGCSFEKSLVV